MLQRACVDYFICVYIFYTIVICLSFNCFQRFNKLLVEFFITNVWAITVELLII